MNLHKVRIVACKQAGCVLYRLMLDRLQGTNVLHIDRVGWSAKVSFWSSFFLISPNAKYTEN